MSSCHADIRISRRARLRGARREGRGALVPGDHRARAARLDRHGIEPPVLESGQIIADRRLVAPIVDRLTFNGHILETGSDSYRL